VQARQAYVFATAGLLGWHGPWQEAASRGVAYLQTRYRRSSGLFRTLVNHDGTPRNDSALLYDQAFGLLAFNVSAMGESRALRERQAHELLVLVLKHMKRAGHPGFETGVPPGQPLQSNPHMHFFEAALAGCEVCSDSATWKSLADEIAALALDKFIDHGSGALREFFDADWKPAPVGTAVGRNVPEKPSCCGRASGTLITPVEKKLPSCGRNGTESRNATLPCPSRTVMRGTASRTI